MINVQKGIFFGTDCTDDTDCSMCSGIRASESPLRSIVLGTK